MQGKLNHLYYPEGLCDIKDYDCFYMYVLYSTCKLNKLYMLYLLLL